MIRRGLRIDDDSDNQIKQERISKTYNISALDANRKRDNFEKDMDNFLFGGPPMRRKQLKTQPPIQKAQPLPTVPTKIEPQVPKRIEPQQPKKIQHQPPQKPILIIENKVSPIKNTLQNPLNKTNSEFGVTNQTNQYRDKQNSSLKNSKVSKAQQSRVSVQKIGFSQQKVLGEKQKSLIFKDIEGSRPNYIRKLRYACQNFNFTEQNLKNHKFVDVVRPLQCSKFLVQKRNVTNFKDKEFPAVQISLGAQLQTYEVEWRKCEDVFKHSTLGKYIDPNDIKKGHFSSSKFLSSLSVLAERQQNIKRLIEQQCLNLNGLYYIRIFVNSIWRFYIVDSFFPFLQDINGGAMSYNDSESDLWVTLIEKAYAKAFNGYDVFTRPQPRQYYLRDLTGAPTSNYMIDNPQILNIVRKAIENKKIVAAVLKSNTAELGLNPNCIMTVLNSNKKGGLTLRYSWPLVQQKAGIPISKEGILDFSDAQIGEYVSYVAIAHVNRAYFTTTIQTKHQKEFYVAYKILIKENTHGYFTISQLDQRLFPKQGCAYEPARIFLYKKTDNTFQYLNGGFSHMSRNLDIQAQLPPGEYQVFAFINWNHHSYDFNLSFYGSKPVEFVKIPTLNNHNMISLGLQSYNLQYGKRSALGHVHQFISYHQQTNLVLVSVTNTSAKKYKYQQDLKKINFQSLHLVNLTNNEHAILESMTKDELQNYKAEALQNRKWEIELGPQQNFTWVISTSEIYDPTNFRNWGFR